MAKKASPRKDFLQIAKEVVEIATGEKPKPIPTTAPKKKAKPKAN